MKEDAIANNINYEVGTEYGDIEITINLSKPEKDAKQLQKLKLLRLLSIQNVLYALKMKGFRDLLHKQHVLIIV